MRNPPTPAATTTDNGIIPLITYTHIRQIFSPQRARPRGHGRIRPWRAD